MKILYSLFLVAIICFCAVIPVFAQDLKEGGLGNATPVITPESTPAPTPRPRVTPVLVPTITSINDVKFDIPWDKQVKDEVVVTQLAKMGIDATTVLLVEDYTPAHPTSQTYLDLKTGQSILTIDSLPHVNLSGEPIMAGWTHFTYGADWTTWANLFTAEVVGTGISITKDGQRCWWNPELYLDGKRIQPIKTKATLIDDSYNPNYRGNTLTWDYQGICTRELRVIEGAIYEKWIFSSDPQGQVIIKHRQGGAHQLNFGFMSDANGMSLPVEVQQNDWEIVEASTFVDPNITYPLYLGASATYYVTHNGVVGKDSTTPYLTWADLIAAAGTIGGEFTGTSGAVISWGTSTTANHYVYLYRSLFFFDTSGLDDGATITGATMSLYGAYGWDELGNTPSLNIYSTTSLSDGGVDKTDYNKITSTAWSATPVTLAAWSTSGYNNWVLNAAGLAGISKTGLTKIGVRESVYDVGAVQPLWAGPGSPWTTVFGIYFLAQGAGFQPKLVVTYTPALPVIVGKEASSITMNSARLNGQISEDGGEPCQIRWGYGNTTKTVGNFNLYDTVTAWGEAEWETGENPYLDVSGLVASTLYYFRVQIKNATGNATSVEFTFTTSDSLFVPTDFVAIPSATSILLSFTKGSGAMYTIIRYSYLSYPLLITDGDLAGNITESSFTHSPLDSGKTVYYSAWAQSGNITSTTYASTLATTLFATTADFTEDAPVMPAGFSQEPDYTAFAGLPGYGGLNSLSDTMGLPRGTTWLIVEFAVMLGLAVAVGLIAGASMGLVASIGVGVAFVIMGGMPSGFLMILGLFALGYGIFKWRSA